MRPMDPGTREMATAGAAPRGATASAAPGGAAAVHGAMMTVGAAPQVMIRWQFQVYTYIHMIWVLEKRRSHPSKKAPSFQCEKGPMILNFPLL